MTYFQGRLVNRPQMAYILPVYDIKRRLLIELPLLLEIGHTESSTVVTITSLKLTNSCFCACAMITRFILDVVKSSKFQYFCSKSVKGGIWPGEQLTGGGGIWPNTIEAGKLDASSERLYDSFHSALSISHSAPNCLSWVLNSSLYWPRLFIDVELILQAISTQRLLTSARQLIQQDSLNYPFPVMAKIPLKNSQIQIATGISANVCIISFCYSHTKRLQNAIKIR